MLPIKLIFQSLQAECWTEWINEISLADHVFGKQNKPIFLTQYKLFLHIRKTDNFLDIRLFDNIKPHYDCWGKANKETPRVTD